jgi:hypothetical protein
VRDDEGLQHVGAQINSKARPIGDRDRASMHLLSSAPVVENGRLFISYRIGVDDPKVTTVVRSIGRVLQAIDYLEA